MTNIRQRVVSVILWVLALSFAVPMLVSMTVLAKIFGAHRMEPINRFYCRTQIALTFNRWTAHVDARVDPTKPYLFLQNHTNHFDHVMMYCATPHFKQGIELASHFSYPFYGWFMKARGTIPVYPGESGQSETLQRRIGELVSRGQSVLAFPEAHRTLDGELRTFRKGMFLLAIKLGLPIVPVTVRGSYRMMRKGSLIIRPGGTLEVFCDAPIGTAGLTPEDVETLMNKVRDTMQSRLHPTAT